MTRPCAPDGRGNRRQLSRESHRILAAAKLSHSRRRPASEDIRSREFDEDHCRGDRACGLLERGLDAITWTRSSPTLCGVVTLPGVRHPLSSGAKEGSSSSSIRVKRKGTVGTSAGRLRTARSALLRGIRVLECGNAERSGRHSHGDRGNECKAGGQRAIDWRSPGVAHSESRGFISESRGVSPGFIPAAIQAAGERAFRWRISRVAPGAPFPRPLRPQESGRSIGVVPGFHLGFTGFHFRIPGSLPGIHSRGLSGRRRCAAVSGSRGFSPGSIPAAIQAAGERAIDWRSPGVAHRIYGVSSPNPGDSPRAPFPRPFRPQESGRFGGGFPGLHLGFPGILPGLHSRGHSGRTRAGDRLA